MKSIFVFVFILLLLSCNKIETVETLSKHDIERIKKLKLLDDDETIYRFYSEYNNKVAGDFFTNKRLAKYWLDEKNKTRNEVSSAFYPDVKSIDTVYYAGATYCPYLLVTKKDDSQFKVCVNGERQEIKSFFDEALNAWTKNKTSKCHCTSCCSVRTMISPLFCSHPQRCGPNSFCIS